MEESARSLLVLHEAVLAWYNNPKLIRRIIELIPDAIKQADSNGQLPLHLAVASPFARNKDKEKVQIVRMLIREYPEALKVQDNDGNLPLHIAASRLNFCVIPLMCVEYGDGAMIKNKIGCLPVDLIWAIYREESQKNLPSGFYNSYALRIRLRWSLYLVSRSCKSKTSRVLCELGRVYPSALPQKCDDNRPTLHNLLYDQKHIDSCFSKRSSCLIYSAMNRVLELDPNSARARDSNGDFPLHVFLAKDTCQCGLGHKRFRSWLKVLIRLIKANPEALLHPFSVNKVLLPLTAILGIDHLLFNYGAAANLLSVVATVCPNSLGLFTRLSSVPFSCLLRAALADARSESHINSNSKVIALLLTSTWDKGTFKSIFYKTFHVLSNYEFSHYDVPLFHILAINGSFFQSQESEDVMLDLIDLGKTDHKTSGKYKTQTKSVASSSYSKESLMEKDQEGNTPLHMACRAPPQHRPRAWGWWRKSTEVLDLEERCEANGIFDLCLRGTMHIPVNTHKVVRTTNNNGELPLHVALRAEIPGHIKSSRIDKLLIEYPNAAVVIDPIMQVYPFMLAALGESDRQISGLETAEGISRTFLLFSAFLSYRDPAKHFVKVNEHPAYG